MLEGSGPRTRFSVTARLLGCTNSTTSRAPILKLCQFSAAFCVVWVMVVVPAPVPMVAVPAATTPPSGRAWALMPKAMAKDSARVPRPRRAPPQAALRRDEVFLPALVAFSGAATKVPVLSFQIDR
jgi:hypothetical protein